MIGGDSRRPSKRRGLRRISRRIAGVASMPAASAVAAGRLSAREDHSQLLWSVHHVAIDGWCLALVLLEVLDRYEAIKSESEPMPPASRPFRHYVGWLQDQDESHASSYWRGVLGDVASATPLGLIEQAPNVRLAQLDTAVEREIRLPAEMTASLQAVARSQRLTLSTLIQGAWALLLSRYSGQDDVVFGVTVSGRPPELSGVESMVGMFINVLPMRVAVTEESNLITWLESYRRTWLSCDDTRRFPSRGSKHGAACRPASRCSRASSSSRTCRSWLVPTRETGLASSRHDGSSGLTIRSPSPPFRVTSWRSGSGLTRGGSCPHRRGGARSPSNPPRGDGFQPRAATHRFALDTQSRAGTVVRQSERTRGHQVLDDIEIDQSAELDRLADPSARLSMRKQR